MTIPMGFDQNPFAALESGAKRLDLSTIFSSRVVSSEFHPRFASFEVSLAVGFS